MRNVKDVRDLQSVIDQWEAEFRRHKIMFATSPTMRATATLAATACAAEMRLTASCTFPAASLAILTSQRQYLGMHGLEVRGGLWHGGEVRHGHGERDDPGQTRLDRFAVRLTRRAGRRSGRIVRLRW